MKLLLFKVHQGDILATAIEAVTRASYTHAAILKDEATNTISEAFFPHVRERVLDNSELHGIDVFDISTTFPQFTPLTADQTAAILAQCAAAEKIHEDYSISNLFRFIPGMEELIGKAQDDGKTSAVFCSQFCADKINDAIGLKLLNADSADLAPGYLSWSPLLFPAPPLKLLTGIAANAPSKPVAMSFATEAVKVAEAAIEAAKPATDTNTTTS